MSCIETDCGRWLVIALCSCLLGCSQQSNRKQVQAEASPVTHPQASKQGGWGSNRSYYRQTWAIIIGIDKYRGDQTGFQPLACAVKDAQMVRDMLRDEFGYAEDRILVVLDEEATAGRIRNAFEKWPPRQGIHADDAIFVFFAGHGTKDGALVCVDSQKDCLDKTSIPISWVRDRLDALPCRHKAVVLDTCYSGVLFGGGGSGSGNPTIPTESPTATRGNEPRPIENFPAVDANLAAR